MKGILSVVLKFWKENHLEVAVRSGSSGVIVVWADGNCRVTLTILAGQAGWASEEEVDYY